MSLQKIHLRKILQFFDAEPNHETSLLRDDIRQTIRKEAGISSEGGGDFFAPFWADAKSHASGLSNLQETTEARIVANKRRENLYPKLRDGFLTWWEEKRRWRNEPITISSETLKHQGKIDGCDCVVKIEGSMDLKVGDDDRRIIYPYFSETPALSAISGRIGLWVMSLAMPEIPSDNFRIIDVIRGVVYTTRDFPLLGDESKLFKERYGRLIARWYELRKEY